MCGSARIRVQVYRFCISFITRVNMCGLHVRHVSCVFRRHACEALEEEVNKELEQHDIDLSDIKDDLVDLSEGPYTQARA